MIPNIRNDDSCRNCGHARVEVRHLGTSSEMVMVWCKKEEAENPEGGPVMVMDWYVCDWYMCDWYQRKAP